MHTQHVVELLRACDDELLLLDMQVVDRCPCSP